MSMAWIKYIVVGVLVLLPWLLVAGEREEYLSMSGDSAYVLRQPGEEFLEKYRNDPEYHYTLEVAPGPGLWDYIKAWLLRKLLGMDGDGDVPFWFTLLMWIGVGLIGIGVGWLFYKYYGKLMGRKKTDAFLMEENEKVYTDEEYGRLLEEALQQKNYVLAIRLHFSALLCLLDERQVIRRQAAKTNRDYQYEIENREWSRRFAGLSRIFDCVTYGDFVISEEDYRQVEQEFLDFEREVRA